MPANGLRVNHYDFVALPLRFCGMPHVFTNNFTYDKYMMRTNEFDPFLMTF